jgi:hypothetical protein
MRKPILYAAGPGGFSESGKLFLYKVLIPLYEGLGFDVRDPWALTPLGLIIPVQNLPYGQEKKENWKRINSIMGENNAKAIEESDVIVADLNGSDVDSGTAGEIGYGTALRKRVIGYRDDFRPSGENEGCLVNLQIEYFIHKSGGEIYADLDSLKKALIDFRDEFYRRNQ